MHWTLANIVRSVNVTVLTACILQMAMMMSHYYWWLIPLRKEIGESKMLAPPVGWTLAYHGCVGTLLVALAITQVQGLWADAPGNFLTYTTTPLGLVFGFVVSQFLRFYTQRLTAEHEYHNHR